MGVGRLLWLLKLLGLLLSRTMLRTWRRCSLVVFLGGLGLLSLFLPFSIDHGCILLLHVSLCVVF